MYALSILLVVAGTLTVSVGVMVAQAAGTAGPIPTSWMSFAGLAALIGLAVEWGENRRRGKEHDGRLAVIEEKVDAAVPRDEFTDRMDRLEDKLDRRFDGLLNALKRQGE